MGPKLECRPQQVDAKILKMRVTCVICRLLYDQQHDDDDDNGTERRSKLLVCRGTAEGLLNVFETEE